MVSLSTNPEVLGWIQSLGWTLLHVLWQGALVGAAYGLARWLIGPSRAQLRYAAGLVALAALAVLPVLTFVSLAPLGASSLGEAGAAISASVAEVGNVAGDAARGFALEPWLPWIVAAWALGVALNSLRASVQYWRLRRLCQLEAEPLPEWEATLRQLAQRFGVTRPVRLVRSAIVQTPSLIGWIAPVIMLPVGVLVGLSPKQIELVIAHELGHIRRWDYAVNLLQIGLESVLFYHPVVHWISREVRHDREACCDDLVLRLGADPMDYATTLASLEDLRGFTHATAVPATGGFLLGRIRRIVGGETRASQPLTGGQSLMMLAIAGAVLMAAQPFTRNVIGGFIERDAVVGEAPGATSALTRAAAISVERAISAVSTPSTPVVEAPPVEAPLALEPVVPEAAAPVAPPPRVKLAFARAAMPQIEAAVVPADIDAAVVTTPTLAPVTVAPDDQLRAIRTAAPVFPRQAAIDGVEGQVTLSFYVDWTGRATQIEVIGATVPETFDAAAIAALRDWRFASDGEMKRRRYQQTFDFTLTGAREKAAPAPSVDECLTPLGTRICRRSLNEIGVARRDVIEEPDAGGGREAWLRANAGAARGT